ncbi:MAG TPA: hypothetical protein PK899_07120, partial [Spirochaetota bacterium]|nr:hypothetical protein [Spirochaetota bacterium]
MNKLDKLLLSFFLFAFLLISCANTHDDVGDGVTTTSTSASTTTTSTYVSTTTTTILQFTSVTANNRLITYKNCTNNYNLLTRDIKVYLPAGYDPSGDATYSVVYMHDGQNLFFAGGP